MSPDKTLASLAFLMFLILVLTCESILVGSVYSRISDEEYYIRAGTEYIKNPSNVLTLNWEHPPLAKYIIGLTVLTLGDFSRLLPYAAGVLILVILSRIINLLELSRLTSQALLALFALDLVHAHVIRYMLLDVFMLLFTCISIYYYLRFLKIRYSIYLLLSAVFMGLAISCKWVALYILIPMLIFLIFSTRTGGGRNLRTSYMLTLGFLFMTAIVYVASYLPALARGVTLAELLDLQLRMLNYHVSFHPYTSFVSLNSLLMFFFKASLWEVFSGGTFYVYTNGTIIQVTGFEYEGWKLYFYFGYGNIGWWLFLPSLAYLLYKLISMYIHRGRVDAVHAFFALSAVFLTIFLLHGDMEWYYFDVMPVFYIVLGFMLRDVRRGWLLYLLLGASALFSLLVLITGRYFIVLDLS